MNAVSKIMGIWLVRKSSFNFRHITMPFITGIMISLTIISGTVSYTHLDVYKRQPMKNIKTEWDGVL